MARVVISARALADLERIADFLSGLELDDDAALGTIFDALAVLERHPLIGRPIDDALRELVIGFGHAGYVALYRYRHQSDRIDVLAVRHQREAGFG